MPGKRITAQQEKIYMQRKRQELLSNLVFEQFTQAAI